jgi:hypothetical protein
MITRLDIEAFKSLEYISIQCSRMNLVTGINSSGKSSFIQSLLVLFQSLSSSVVDSENNINQVLNGRLVTLGDFRDIKCINSVNQQIKILGYVDGFDKPCGVIIKADEVEDSSDSSIIADFLPDGDNSIYNKISAIKYLDCNRIGALDIFQKNYFGNDLGIHGEYMINYLDKNKNDLIDEALFVNEENTTRRFIDQVNYWLRYIINSNIETENIGGTDVIKASYSVGDNYRQYRPRNVGAGISYLISILILCLGSKDDDLIIIENPEIHLHPSAQSRLVEFLYFISRKGNRQLFIETHSDHIINGIRAGIATHSMDLQDIVINYFELDKNNSTVVTKIELNDKGVILNAAPGFLDQFSIDLDKMLGI